MTEENDIEIVGSEAGTCDSDDSQEDPSFDVLEDSRSRFSNLSIKKNSKSRVHKEVDNDVLDVDDADGIEMDAPELDAKDQKNFETVQKIIEVGQVVKLKVEQCKLYLRKHGLRLTGKKDILIQRIKEHVSIMNGEGEHKYPASSFVLNCKGDACTGDIVMFEQNVYEMFNIASRSASGPPCGTRIVAGRIVKESYGAAKQQHTFTIEVLWSKGVKPLPALHPLLIKGRNLYRLKTMRQRWEDESQRHTILSEKHARGNAARSDRETRFQEKEQKKALRESRASKKSIQNEKQEKKIKTSLNQPIVSSRNPTKQDLQNTSIQLRATNWPPLYNTHAGVPSQGVFGNRTLTSMVQNHHEASYKENINFNILRSLVRGEPNVPFRKNMGFCPFSQIERQNYDASTNFYHSHIPSQSHSFQGCYSNGHCHSQVQRQQPCRYYAQGRCHYGTNCKYLH